MKIFVGVCNSQDDMPSDFFWSFAGLSSPCEFILKRSRHPWDVVRNNRIIDSFLKSGCDILAKMDIDQTYPKNYFHHFIPLVEKYKAIGPLICDRYEENNFVPLAFENKSTDRLKRFNLSNKNGIIKIPYAHTNLFYAREIWEKIPPPWYEARLSKDGLNRANHVDFDVLDKIKDAGYPIHIDIDTKVGHRNVSYK